MRYLYPVLVLLCGSVLFLSTTTEENVLASIFLVDEDKVPDLPEVPYEYGNIQVPEHLLLTKHARANNNGFGMLSDDGITLGRVLFYDELLSANENISCASCHEQALSFAEDEPFSVGVNEDTKRNALHLNDVAWSNSFGYFWDLSGGNLEEMIALPLQHENEIGITNIDDLIRKLEQTTYYPDLFEAAFGSSQISLLRVQSALGLFLRSMTTFDSKFDQVQRGEAEFTLLEERGSELFLQDCGVCHTDGNSRLTNEDQYPQSILSVAELFENRMIVGADIGAGSWNNMMTGRFKVPTLRNIELTAPYMHDGRFADLDEVLEHYSDGILAVPPNPWSANTLPSGGFKYTDQEKLALKAFLRTLTDLTITQDVRWSDPFGATTVSTETPGPVEADALEIFPNPSNGLTQIYFDNPSGSRVQAELLNMEGRLVRKLSTHTNTILTDVSQLPAGIYVVRLRSQQRFIDKKLMVQ